MSPRIRFTLGTRKPSAQTADTLYPTIYPEDLRAEAWDFYRRFYRVEVDGGRIGALLP